MPGSNNSSAPARSDNFVTYKAFVPIIIAIIVTGAGMTSYVLNLFAENSKAADAVLRVQVEAVNERANRSEVVISGRLIRIENKLDLLIRGPGK